MYTLKDNKLENIPNVIFSENGIYDLIIDAPHLYVSRLNEDYYLIIDSFLDIVDVISNSYITYKDNKITFSKLRDIRFLKNRYSRPTTLQGIKQIQERYQKQLSEDILNKKIVVYTLCPTFSCNMMCTYCYQKNYEKSYFSISQSKLDEILLKIKNEIIEIRKKDSNRPIVLELFGGEPLQKKNSSIIENYLKFAREMQCKVWIVSNGYELYDFAILLSKFQDVIEQIFITIDGPKDFHNSRRFVASEKGSFDKIVDGIDLFLELGFRVRVASNMDAENIVYIDELVEFIQSKNWPQYKGFLLSIGRVYDRLQSNKYEKIIYESTIFNSLLSLKVGNSTIPEWISIGFPQITERLAKKINVSLNKNEYGKALFHYCWATSPIIDGYYVDNEGKTYRCTTTVANSEYSLGNIDKVTHNTYKSTEWICHNLFRSEKCLSCNIGGFCSGGCPLEQRTYGDIACENEKDNFNDFIENIFKPRIIERINN